MIVISRVCKIKVSDLLFKRLVLIFVMQKENHRIDKVKLWKRSGDCKDSQTASRRKMGTLLARFPKKELWLPCSLWEKVL